VTPILRLIADGDAPQLNWETHPWQVSNERSGIAMSLLGVEAEEEYSI
jgi:hypothetical protein